MGISHVNDRDWPIGDCPVQSGLSRIPALPAAASADQIKTFSVLDASVGFR